MQFSFNYKIFYAKIGGMERIKIVIQYNGKNFSGFQVQPEKRTIQGEIEKVLEFLFKMPIKIYAAGRTDAKVSALAQVAHFDIDKDINEKSLLSSMNALLPDDIAILEVEKVTDSFDARFSVKKKTYWYKFYVSKFELPLFKDTALRINDYADVKLMNDACKYLVGEHDFESFVARKSGKTDFVRTIYDAKIISIGDGLYALEITGNGFLYNMVRIIFGTLLMVGYKKIKPEEIKDIIEAKSRERAGKTMPAEALLMKKVEY